MQTIVNIMERLPVRNSAVIATIPAHPAQAMATPSNYVPLYADASDPSAEATTLQRATYAKQLRTLEGCLAGLRSSLCVDGSAHYTLSSSLKHSAQLDASVQKLGRHVHECRQLFAGLSTAAQQVARPPVPSPNQLVDNLHTVWYVRASCDHISCTHDRSTGSAVCRTRRSSAQRSTRWCTTCLLTTWRRSVRCLQVCLASS